MFAAVPVVAVSIVVVALCLAALMSMVIGDGVVAANAPDDAPVTTQLEPAPPVTANDFLPEERDVTDCIGVLERPGCGSESRGGWRQTLILVAIFVGLGVVFGNVIRGVRRNRS